MSYLGSWKIDDALTFYVNTHDPTDGSQSDADAAPGYRVYEDETATPLLTGSMALLDAANTDGFYSEQITLSAANGFEKGKCYSIRVQATVNSVVGSVVHTFQMEAEVDANVVSDKSGYSISGTLTTLDALDTAQDTQHSTTQTAIGNLNDPTAAAIRAEIDSNSTQLAAIVADTNELQTDDVPGLIAALNNLSAAQVNAEVDTALADIHLDHLFATDYDPASKPGTATALLNELVESDSGVSRFTANALEEAPTGGSAPTAGEIADAVWDEAKAGHVGAGSFGEEVQAHALSTDIDALNDLSAAEVNAEVDTAIETYHLDHLLAATYDPSSKPGAADALLNELIENDGGVARFTANALEEAPTGGSAPTAEEIADQVWDEAQSGHTTAGSFGEIATEIASILADTNELQTDDIPGAIAALENLSQAEAQTAAAAALTAYDPPTHAELVSEIDDVQTDIGNLSIPSAASIASAVWSAGTRLLTAGTNIVLAKGTGVTGFNDLSAAEVNTEVVDALNVDTYAEPGQGAPGATISLAAKINYLYKAWRNRVTQTDDTFSLYADDATTVDQKATVSDNGTTFDRGEISTGP